MDNLKEALGNLELMKDAISNKKKELNKALNASGVDEKTKKMFREKLSEINGATVNLDVNSLNSLKDSMLKTYSI